MDLDEAARLRKEKMSELKRHFENEVFRDDLVTKLFSLFSSEIAKLSGIQWVIPGLFFKQKIQFFTTN